MRNIAKPQNYQCVQNHETWLTSRTRMSQYLNRFLETSIFAVSNGTSFMSVEGRVQEIQSHKFTRVHPNHKWFISRAHSSTSDGDVTIPLHALINFNLCCIQWFKSDVHRSRLHPTVQVSCP